MAIHQNFVIDDSFYDIRRLQSQYPQLIKYSTNKFNPKDVKALLGIGCFSLTRRSVYQRGNQGEPLAVRCPMGWTAKKDSVVTDIILSS